VGAVPERSILVAQLADEVRRNAAADPPAWTTQLHTLLPAALIADVQVWRAATQIHPCDLRATGPSQLGRVNRIFQQQLDERLAAAAADTDRRWGQLLATEVPCVTADPFLPELAERLTNLARAGFDATWLVRSAAAARPLPDDHPAAALWWRILDQLPPQTPKFDPTAPQRRLSDKSHQHEVTRPRATRTAIGAATCVRPKSLKVLPHGEADHGYLA
jgi:hypothetical protein